MGAFKAGLVKLKSTHSIIAHLQDWTAVIDMHALEGTLPRNLLARLRILNTLALLTVGNCEEVQTYFVPSTSQQRHLLYFANYQMSEIDNSAEGSAEQCYQKNTENCLK